MQKILVCNTSKSNKNDLINATRVYFDLDLATLDQCLKQFDLGNGPQAFQFKDTSLDS